MSFFLEAVMNLVMVGFGVFLYANWLGGTARKQEAAWAKRAWLEKKDQA